MKEFRILFILILIQFGYLMRISQEAFKMHQASNSFSCVKFKKKIEKDFRKVSKVLMEAVKMSWFLEVFLLFEMPLEKNPISLSLRIEMEIIPSLLFFLNN